MDKLLKDSGFNMSRGSSGNPLNKAGTGTWEVYFGSYGRRASTDASLFSTSLPIHLHKKQNFIYPGDHVLGHEFNISMLDNKDDAIYMPEDGDNGIAKSDLPDEDMLLDGVLDDLDLDGLPSQLEDLDDYDIFGSGGGLELDNDLPGNLSSGLSSLNISNAFTLNGGGQYVYMNGTGTVAGEHPLGEHPSRTLFVRNINSNVEDSELRSLFEPCGDIRNLYTACKHRGFVIISYYDIRDALKAKQTLQNKPLRRRKLDIHFSIPKENPSEKDINQGTLVVFNVDASVSTDALRLIFGVHGAIKEIRETPNKKHQKFIEFYDVRDAGLALTALNRSEIAGKRIKVEYSRPGGLKRNFMQPLNQDIEQDEARTFWQQSGSPLLGSPPGTWIPFGRPIEKNDALHAYSRSLTSLKGSDHGLAPVLSHHKPVLPKIAPIGKDRGRINNESGTFINSVFSQESGYLHSRSVPDQSLLASSGPFSAVGESNSPSSGVATLSSTEFLWGSPPTSYSELSSSSGWPSSPAEFTVSFSPQGRTQGFPHQNGQNRYLGAQVLSHVGSAPSGVQLEYLSGFPLESPESSFTNTVSVGSLDLNPGNYGDGGRHRTIGTVVSPVGSMGDGTLLSFGMPLMQKHGMIHGNGAFFVPGATGFEGFRERGRNQRGDVSINQLDNDKYMLDLDRIVKGEDNRTTLMIKNIPNKYTTKMLLACIDEHHRRTYDFLYLPIDFKNKCNVGYAFINMVSTSHVISFYKKFNGKKWENFNSGKIASLAYARIQGRVALINHFQNSSLMNEDKWCRPIVFHLDGQEAIDKEYIRLGNLNICVHQEDGNHPRYVLSSTTESEDDKPEGLDIGTALP
ncbi:hypothetical protein MLD38_020051 [Melastoma candidum]|uniref:Uncharacterized protein n=1 Tax=Melastoma candidum TaxID=119954 RepID=A0ACB9QCN8_9MYRT|nr:hypothetical protein MLD38_020051 [Melastoma candidum]